MYRIAINKLKPVLATILQIGDRDPQFFLALAYCALFRAFAFFDFATRAIDLAFAQTGFLVEQENPSKIARAHLARSPALPPLLPPGRWPFRAARPGINLTNPPAG